MRVRLKMGVGSHYAEGIEFVGGQELVVTEKVYLAFPDKFDVISGSGSTSSSTVADTTAEEVQYVEVLELAVPENKPAFDPDLVESVNNTSVSTLLRLIDEGILKAADVLAVEEAQKKRKSLIRLLRARL